MKFKKFIKLSIVPGIIILIPFFLGLFVFINFFEYAKTFYDISPGEIIGDVNFSTYPGAVYIFFIYLLFQYVRTRNLKYIDIAIMFLSCFVFARTFSIFLNGLSYSLFIPIALVPEYIGLPFLIYIRKKILWVKLISIDY